jgi:outer membrane protein TolC
MHRAFAALVAAVLAVPAAAGQPTVVTEAEFLAAVGDDHPALAALRAGVGNARTEALAAAAIADPEVGAIREDPEGGAEQIDLTIAWQPPRPGRRLAVTAAEHGIAAAEARLESERLALHLVLHQVYAGWAIATERTDRLAGHAARIAELARREAVRAERGEVSGLEARRLALAADEAASRLALAEADAEAARATARGWMPALRDSAIPELPGLVPRPAALPAEHPRLIALEQDLAAARLSRRAAERIVRWPEVVAGWQRQELDDGSAEGPILGFSWPLPLLDRNRAERSLAATREETAEARLEAARRRLEADRAGALAAYGRLEVAARDAHRAAGGSSTMVAAAVAAFEQGEASVTDLLETLRSAVESESTVLDLHSAALAAFRRLEDLAGRPLDPHHRTTLEPNGETP